MPEEFKEHVVRKVLTDSTETPFGQVVPGRTISAKRDTAERVRLFIEAVFFHPQYSVMREGPLSFHVHPEVFRSRQADLPSLGLSVKKITTPKGLDGESHLVEFEASDALRNFLEHYRHV